MMTGKDLVEKYKLHEYFPETPREQLEGIYDGIHHTLQDDEWGESELWNEMLSLDKKPISEIRVTRGGKEFRFKNTLRLKFIAEQFAHWGADEYQSTAIEDLKRWYYNNPRYTQMSERQRCLLIHDLLINAGFPFTRQQLQANDQTKASLIRNWMNAKQKQQK